MTETLLSLNETRLNMLFSPMLPEQGARGLGGICYEHAKDMKFLPRVTESIGLSDGEGGKWKFLELPQPMAGS